MSTDSKSLVNVMTPTEVMTWLKVKRTKLYDLIDQGLPFHSLSPGGRTKVFYPAEVQTWLDGRGTSRAKSTVEGAEPGAPRRGRPRKTEAPAVRKWIKR
jgi:predicted DNA-binding transcriptional regulator AlpA